MVARRIGKLSPAEVRNKVTPGVYGDGGGLYLTVGATGSKSWLFRFMLNGTAREMGLGPTHTIGLGEARERARAARKLRLEGIDPIEDRKAARMRRTAAEAAETASHVTFYTAAQAYIEANKAAWRSEKHGAQWTSSLAAYVYPTIADVSVSAIETGHVTAILTPIWSAKAETASRVRGRIETVLDFAKAHGWRSGENPARWRGHLENVFPSRGRVAKVEHHPALPWANVASFMATLEAQDGVGAMAFRFAVLTAGRTAEVLGARWSEIDLPGAVWTIPAARMKAGQEHRVPLSEAALGVLQQAATLRRPDVDGPIFPGGKVKAGLSGTGMLDVLRRMGRDDITVHGFRSTFRDWCAEKTTYQREVVEAALAHTIGSKVEAAYRRGDLFEKRRRLMDDWADWCGRRPQDDGKVVQLRAGAV
jgi:integrase